jgi:hypothetical protein
VAWERCRSEPIGRATGELPVVNVPSLWEELLRTVSKGKVDRTGSALRLRIVRVTAGL